MRDDLIELAKQQAAEIASAGHNGWGNTLLALTAALEAAREDGAEIAKLVEFFRGEGYQAFGWDGDVSNLSPADTAIKAMRAAMQKRSPSMRITLVDRGGGALAIRHWHNDADLPAGDYILYAEATNA